MNWYECQRGCKASCHHLSTTNYLILLNIFARQCYFKRNKADDSVIFIDASAEYGQAVTQYVLRPQDRATILDACIRYF